MAGSVTDKLVTLGELKLGLDTKVGTSDVQDIEHGGTNAATAATARTNLDVYSKGETDSAISQSMASMFVGRTPYTPTISCASPGFAYDNAAFLYSRAGKLLFISGRLNITNIGTAASTNSFSISLPSGYTCSDFVGSIGSIAVNKNGVDVLKLSIRQTSSNSIYIQSGAGGVDSLNIIGTGYIMLYATVMLN